MATDLVSSYRAGQVAAADAQAKQQSKFLKESEKIRNLPTKAGEMFGVTPTPEPPVVPTDETDTTTTDTTTTETTDTTTDAGTETGTPSPMDPNLEQAQKNQFLEQLDDNLSNIQATVANNDGALSSMHYQMELPILTWLNEQVTGEPPMTDERRNSIMLNLSTTNQNEKTLRNEIATLDINGLGNYKSDYNKGIFLSYLDPNTPRKLRQKTDANGVLTDEYEWVFYDQQNDNQFTTEDVNKILKNSKRDTNSEVTLNELKATITQKSLSVEPPPNLGPGQRKEFFKNELDNYTNNHITPKVEELMKSGDINSLINDPLHGRIFAEDINKHPIFAQWERGQETNIFGNVKRRQGLVEQEITADQLNRPYNENNPSAGGIGLDVTQLPTSAFTREPGELNWYDNLSRNDIAKIKDAIVNTESPHYNPQVTKSLLAEYYTNSFKQLYKNSIKTGDQYTYTPDFDANDFETIE